MRRCFAVVVAALLLAALGCGSSEKDRNINSNKDVPRTSTQR